MTRDEFIDEFLPKIFDDITALFLKKNVVYSKKDDVLSNLKEIATSVYGANTIEALYSVIATLLCKHVNIILRKDGFMYSDIKERVLDVIVYCLLILVLLDESDGREM